MQDVYFDKEELKDIADENNLRFIVLFGSQATGRAVPESDVDIAVWSDERPLPVDIKSRLVNVFCDLLDRDDVDVVVLNFADPTIQIEVADHGKLLYEREPCDFARFCLRAIKALDDGFKLSLCEERYLKERIAARLQAAGESCS